MPTDPEDTAHSLREQAAIARRLADDFSPRDTERLRKVADELEARAAELDAANNGEPEVGGSG